MKKTIFAMVMAGSSMVMFAQTTPTTTPVNPTTTPTTPTTSTSPTTPVTNQSTTNGSVTNSTTDPMSNTTNSSVNNNVNTGVTSTNTAPWTNSTPPSWGWRSYGIWDANRNTGMYNGSTINSNPSMTTNGGTINNSGINNGTVNSGTITGTTTTTGTTPSTEGWNTTTNSSINGSTSVGTMDASMNSTGYYDAYKPTENVTIPWNVQNNYSKEYPTASAGNGTWSQYGDWFYTTYMNNGRYSQIFYDNRGRGYSVALPVLNTYVPENIVASALQRYGSSLYSITSIKGTEGKEVYKVDLLTGGQVKSEWLGDDGTSVANIYRVDEVETASTDMNSATNTTAEGTMTTTDANAAMDNTKSMDAKKTKTKILHEDGSKTKIKTKNGKTKVKEIPAPQNDMNQQ